MQKSGIYVIRCSVLLIQHISMLNLSSIFIANCYLTFLSIDQLCSSTSDFQDFKRKMKISERCSELNASSKVLVLIIWILSNQIQVAQLSLTNEIRCWVFYFCWSAEHINVQYFRVNWPARLFCPQEKFCWNKIYWQIVRTTFCNTIVMRTILTSSFCRGLWIFRKRNCWFDMSRSLGDPPSPNF